MLAGGYEVTAPSRKNITPGKNATSANPSSIILKDLKSRQNHRNHRY
jgi:hypothetical protein